MNIVSRKIAIFVAVVALAFAAAPAAMAQSSREGYITPGGEINERVDPGGSSDSGNDDGGSTPATKSTSNGGNGDGGDSTLPFTGSDLGLLAGAGLLLLGLGIGMRRLTRPSAA